MEKPKLANPMSILVIKLICFDEDLHNHGLDLYGLKSQNLPISASGQLTNYFFKKIRVLQ
jgi:hypothetical protein